MGSLDAPPLDAVFRRKETADAVNERRLAAQVTRGEVERIAPGSYTTARAWASLDPMDRHAQRVWEAASRTAPGTIFSHCSAAALLGIDVFGAWPALVDVSVDRRTGGRSTGRVRRRTRRIDGLDVIPWREHFVTSPAQTVVDLAAALPFVHGVVSADRALWARRRGGQLITPSDLLEAAAVYAGRGARRAMRVAEFASSHSDSVRESQSRVLIDLLGFPTPVLQREFILPSGRKVRSDFCWEEWSHVGEFDGVGKYRDPALLQGRTPEQALIEEKDREDELRRMVRAFSRWRTPQLEEPARLYDILTRAGLPSTRPRPGR